MQSIAGGHFVLGNSLNILERMRLMGVMYQLLESLLP